MLFCPNCKEPRKQEDHFCGLCGEKLAQPAPGPFVTQMDMTVADVRVNLARVYIKMNKIDQAKELIDNMIGEENPCPQVIQLSEELQSILAEKGAC